MSLYQEDKNQLEEVPWAKGAMEKNNDCRDPNNSIKIEKPEKSCI